MTVSELLEIFDLLIKRKSEAPVSQAELAVQQFVAYCLQNHHFSKAQLFQDLYAAFRLDEKPNGFFVEFGACDGVTLSNTFLLEKGLGWRGVVAEPWHGWHKKLKAERTCLIDTRCVWDSTGAKIRFSGIPNLPELSTATELRYQDFNAKDRREAAQEEIEVETISLNDLLKNSEAPRDFDYLSIDTEGSELRILQSLDFSRWQPKIITVEHNFTNQRAQIHQLLLSHGYVQELETFSKWDDWYFRLENEAAG